MWSVARTIGRYGGSEAWLPGTGCCRQGCERNRRQRGLRGNGGAGMSVGPEISWLGAYTCDGAVSLWVLRGQEVLVVSPA
jgi:hypothetical protein